MSMTGYGEARGQAEVVSAIVEVRTVNSRHFKLNFRASEGYASLESDIEAVARETIRRGTVYVNIRVDRQATPDDYRINCAVLANYQRQLESFPGLDTKSDPVRLEALLSLPGTIEETSHTNLDPHADWALVEPVLREALAAVAKMRSEEGAALLDDLAQNGKAVEQFLEKIAERSPDVTESYRARLAQRVNKSLAELNVTLDPTDLLREVSLFADRSDISEELVRLRSHLQQYAEALELAESSGRKLEFIVQEMGREINTIGSKANDSEISRSVVEIKSLLERVREQIQNVE